MARKKPRAVDTPHPSPRQILNGLHRQEHLGYGLDSDSRLRSTSSLPGVILPGEEILPTLLAAPVIRLTCPPKPFWH